MMRIPVSPVSLCWWASLVLMLAGSSIFAQSSQQDLADDPDYVVVDPYQHYGDDSLRMEQVLGVTVGYQIGTSDFVFEWQRPLIPFIRMRGRLNEDRVAASALVMSTSMALTAWVMALSGAPDHEIERSAVRVLAPWGPHFGYRPSRLFTLYAGAIPDIVLFTEDDGLLLQGRVGLRIDAKTALVLNLGYAKVHFWGFENPSRTFPGGVFIGLSYSPPSGALEYYRQ